MFKVNGFSLPYAWNHTITYDEDYGRMPYLVQRLTASDLYVDFDISKEVLQYQVAASIAKGGSKHAFVIIPVLPFKLTPFNIKALHLLFLDCM